MPAGRFAVLILFAPFTVIACWSLVGAWRTGKIRSRGWTFQADKSPIGFWLVAVCHFGILVFSLALALHAFGLIGDPVRIYLPRFD
jgi:hypothetical protein